MIFNKCLFAAFLAISIINVAYADLLISPTRVSFEERDRTDKVTLINTGKKTRTYRVEWKEQTAGEFGAYGPVTDPDFKSASKFLRFSPRQVTLGPGERQVVKLLLRRSNDMLDGEYRSHLKFVILPEADDIDSTIPKEGISMKLNLFLSYSIPVIVKQGTARVSTKIDNLIVNTDEKGNLALRVDMSKSTEFGATGDVVAYFKDSDNSLIELARLNGINFFHEQETRKVNLVTVANLPNKPGNIIVRYVGIREFVGKVLAEKQFPI